jgi:hypothetical protein
MSFEPFRAICLHAGLLCSLGFCLSVERRRKKWARPKCFLVCAGDEKKKKKKEKRQVRPVCRRFSVMTISFFE